MNGLRQRIVTDTAGWSGANGSRDSVTGLRFATASATARIARGRPTRMERKRLTGAYFPVLRRSRISLPVLK